MKDHLVSILDSHHLLRRRACVNLLHARLAALAAQCGFGVKKMCCVWMSDLVERLKTRRYLSKGLLVVISDFEALVIAVRGQHVDDFSFAGACSKTNVVCRKLHVFSGQG